MCVCVFNGKVNALFFKQAFKGTEGKGDIGRWAVCVVNRDFRLGQAAPTNGLTGPR